MLWSLELVITYIATRVWNEDLVIVFHPSRCAEFSVTSSEDQGSSNPNGTILPIYIFSKSGKLKGRDHLEDLVIDGMITLKWISRK
jgi:hypothetical protein